MACFPVPDCGQNWRNCWMYWCASLMWFINAVFEYAELGAEYFTPDPVDMLNDFILDCPLWLSVLSSG